MMKLFLEAIGAASATAFIVAIVLLVVLWPLVIIWAINTLFGFSIAYTFLNWLAVLVLTTAFGRVTYTTK